MKMLKNIRVLFMGMAFAAATLAAPAKSDAQIAVGISIRIGPPVLPVYVQPVCPAAGYIWTPGYWAYGPDGYYWVPGTWVMPPTVGLLWTPGYWGWSGGVYLWHAGYWGPHVGFYGGVNYGFGYGGVGLAGGAWRGGVFTYNRAVTNVDVTVVHNTYNETVINRNTTVSRVSFNGGEGGTTAQPTAEERAAANEHHIEATEAQQQHEHAASTNRAQLASVNHGQPSVAASARPGEFSGKGVVAANKAERPNRPPNASNGGKGPGGGDNAAANNNHNDRPPSATNRATPAEKPSTTPAKNANNAKTAQNTSRPSNANSNAKPSKKAAPKSNDKPEHNKSERP